MKLLTLLAAAAAQLKGRKMKTLLIAVLLVFAFAATANAEVNLKWSPGSITANHGEVIEATVYANRDGDDSEPFDQVDLVMVWIPRQLSFVGANIVEPDSWEFATYPSGDDDPDDWNSSLGRSCFLRLEADEPLIATASGIPLVTFQFRVVGERAFTFPLGLYWHGAQVRPGVYYQDANVTGDVGVATVSAGRGAVSLEWRPPLIATRFGQHVVSSLYAVAADGDMAIVLVDLPFKWSFDVLRFVGVGDTGEYDATFPTGSDGLNAALDDGDAWLRLRGDIDAGYPFATPEGLLLATFEFEVVGDGAATMELMRDYMEYHISAAVYGLGTGRILDECGDVEFVPCVGLAAQLRP